MIAGMNIKHIAIGAAGTILVIYLLKTYFPTTATSLKV